MLALYIVTNVITNVKTLLICYNYIFSWIIYYLKFNLISATLILC